MRLKSVADGQQVEIPVPRTNRTVGTRKGRKSRERKNRFKRKGKSGRQIPRMMLKRDEERTYSSEASEPMPSRKAAIVLYEPVP